MRFEPAVYEHAARLIGETPWAVSRDADLLFKAHATAWRRYRHRPVTVGIDLYNVEPEAYGAEIARPDGNGMPSAAAPIGDSAERLLALPPLDPFASGRLPMVLDTAARLAAALPEATVAVPISGPFSVAAHLVGLENLLCETLVAPDTVRQALAHLVEGQTALCHAIAERGLGITIFESAATPPMLAPDTFVQVEIPALTALVHAATQATGVAPACILGGNTTPVLDVLLATGAGALICPCETDQVAFMTVMIAHPQVAVRVNMNPAPVSRNDWPAIHAELNRARALAAAHPNACIGAGAIPYETTPETVLAMIEWARIADSPV